VREFTRTIKERLGAGDDAVDVELTQTVRGPDDLAQRVHRDIVAEVKSADSRAGLPVTKREEGPVISSGDAAPAPTGPASAWHAGFLARHQP
jgi:hypothetical protein